MQFCNNAITVALATLSIAATAFAQEEIGRGWHMRDNIEAVETRMLAAPVPKQAVSLKPQDEAPYVSIPRVMPTEEDEEEEGSVAPMKAMPGTPSEVDSEVRALARNLQNNFDRILDYVKNRITTEFYYGIKKGAAMTMYDGAGNDYDKANLFIQLCIAAGYAPEAFYFYKTTDVVDIVREDPYWPWWSSPGESYSVQSLTGMNGDEFDNYHMLNKLADIPWWPMQDRIALSRIKVAVDTAALGLPSGPPYQVYDLLLNNCHFPLGKIPITPNIDAQRLLNNTTGAGGTVTASGQTARISGMNEARLGQELVNQSAIFRDFAADDGGAYEDYIDTLEYLPNLEEAGAWVSLESFYGHASASALQQAIEPDATYKFRKKRSDGTYGYENHDTTCTDPIFAVLYRNVPAHDYSTLNIVFAEESYAYIPNANQKVNLADLGGKRLWISFEGRNIHTRLDDGALMPVVSLPGNNTKFRTWFIIEHAYDAFDVDVEASPLPRQTDNNVYSLDDEHVYNIAYAFTAGESLLAKRRQVFADMVREGKQIGYLAPDGSYMEPLPPLPTDYVQFKSRLTAEGLNVMGLDWMMQTQKAGRMLADISGCSLDYVHRLGRTAQEAGYYIDVGTQLVLPLGMNSEWQNGVHDCFDAASIVGSALEHSLIEQSQGMEGVSTVKILCEANRRSPAVPLVLIERMVDVNTTYLTGYTQAELWAFQTKWSAGASASILIPENKNVFPSHWAWKGYGYMVVGSRGSGNRFSEMAIAPDLQGGYGAMLDTLAAGYLASNDPSRLTLNPNATTPSQFYMPTPGADPVDLRTGAYVYETEDLSTGGLAFTRYYNSQRNDQNDTGMGNGWTHGFDIRLTRGNAASTMLGGGTPVQMAPFLTGLRALMAVYSDYGMNETRNDRVRRLAVANLIGNWTVDTLRDSAVTLTMGKETMQFTRTRNVSTSDSWLPPLGTNLVLARVGSGSSATWVVSEPYGKTMRFNTDDKISSIEDALGRTTTFDYYYNGSLYRVQDHNGKQITLLSNGDYIFQISDGTRNITYAHSFPNSMIYSDVNLLSATDSLGSLGSYTYDSDDKMTALRNGKNETVVANTYGEDGKVVSQRSHGDPSRTWNFRYTVHQSYEEDPYENSTRYTYAKDGHCTETMNQLGRTKSFLYDAQGRVTRTTLPNGDQIRATYDQWHNKLTEDVYEGGVAWRSGTFNIYETPSGSSVPRLQHSYREIPGDFRNASVDAYLTLGTAPNARGTLLPTATTDERGIATTYAYDTLANYGRLLAATTGGRTTTYAYADATFRDKPTKITRPDGTYKDITYNARGDVQTVTTSAGATTAFTYDARRRLTATTTSGSGIATVNTSTAYDAADNVVSRTSDADNITTTYTWSAQKKLLNTQSTGGVSPPQTTTHTYDLADRLVKTTLPDGKEIDYTLDAAGQTAAQTFAGRTTSFAYDRLGRPIKTTSPLGIETSQTHSMSKTTATDGRGNTTQSMFNGYGEQTQLVNRLNQTFNFANDIAARTSTLTTPTGKVTKTNYAAGTWDLASVVAPANTTTSFIHHPTTGKLTSAADPSGTIAYEYHANNGLLKKATEGSKEIEYTYDALGRVTSSTAENRTVAYTYTPSGKIATVTYPSPVFFSIGPKTVTYAYDGFDRLWKVTDWANRVTTYSYDIGNRLTRIDRPNGTYRVLTYDAATGNIKAILEYMANGDPIAAFSYRYDLDNRITGVTRGPLPESIERATFAATYDADNRLATFKGEDVLYDTNGNMIQGPLGEDINDMVFLYGVRNQLSLLLDESGPLPEVKASYTYDCEGNRTLAGFAEPGMPYNDAKTVYQYIYSRSGGMNNVLIRSKTVDTPSVYTRSCTYYVYGAGLCHEVTFDEWGSEIDVKYYHYDQIGSTVALTNASGTVTDRFSYDTWGYHKQTLGTSDTPFRYVGIFGVQTDPNGLINMRARYYNPTTLSFITADPIKFDGGMNWYLYADGNPLALIDAFGLCADSANSGYWGDFLGGSALGTSFALNSATQIFVNGTAFNFSLTPPTGAWIPPGGSTSSMFMTQAGRPNIGLRLDYGHNVATGSTNWHWNQKGVANVFNVTNHSTAGASVAGGVVTTLKYGGRAMVVGGVVVSGYEIATSPNPGYEAGRQASGWAGATAGAYGGAKGGAIAGGAVGAWIGGVGAVPGAAIGGAIGGLGGGAIGWFGGTKTYEAVIPTPR